ncbi:unnamed protein product [Lampetra fluviatilis]
MGPRRHRGHETHDHAQHGGPQRKPPPPPSLEAVAILKRALCLQDAAAVRVQRGGTRASGIKRGRSSQAASPCSAICAESEEVLPQGVGPSSPQRCRPARLGIQAEKGIIVGAMGERPSWRRFGSRQLAEASLPATVSCGPVPRLDAEPR